MGLIEHVRRAYRFIWDRFLFFLKIRKRKKLSWELATPAEDGGEAFLPPVWPDREADERMIEALIAQRQNPHLSKKDKKKLDEQIEAVAQLLRL